MQSQEKSFCTEEHAWYRTNAMYKNVSVRWNESESEKAKSKSMVKLQKLFVVQRTGIKRVKIVFKLTSKGTRKSIWSESRSVHEDEIRVGCSGGEREDKKKEQACGMPVNALCDRGPLSTGITPR